MRDGVLLPGPGARLQREDREVGELGEAEQRRGAVPPGVGVVRLRVVPGGAGEEEEVVVAVAARQDPRLVARQEARERQPVERRGVEEVRVEDVRQRVQRRVVGEEHGVGLGGAGHEAAVEEGLQLPGVRAVPGAGAVVGARAQPVIGQGGARRDRL